MNVQQAMKSLCAAHAAWQHPGQAVFVLRKPIRVEMAAHLYEVEAAKYGANILDESLDEEIL